MSCKKESAGFGPSYNESWTKYEQKGKFRAPKEKITTPLFLNGGPDPGSPFELTSLDGEPNSLGLFGSPSTDIVLGSPAGQSLTIFPNAAGLPVLIAAKTKIVNLVANVTVISVDPETEPVLQGVILVSLWLSDSGDDTLFNRLITVSINVNKPIDVMNILSNEVAVDIDLPSGGLLVGGVEWRPLGDPNSTATITGVSVGLALV